MQSRVGITVEDSLNSSLCLDEAISKHGKKSSFSFSKYFSKIIQQMKENAVSFYFLIDFLDTRSFFLPANQNARLTIHNKSKFM